MFVEKKSLRPLGVRQWICVFFYIFLIKNNNSDGSGSNECAYCSDFLKYDFYYFKFLPLYTVFSIPINIWEFFAP
jgi:hypothetical protein